MVSTQGQPTEDPLAALRERAAAEGRSMSDLPLPVVDGREPTIRAIA